MMRSKTWWLGFFILPLFACSSVYYNALERMGIQKREILVDRVKDARSAQVEGKEEIRSALNEFKAVIQFDGGNLESKYNKLKDEYEDSQDAADKLKNRIDSVESVAEALFDEWQDELKEYKDAQLKRKSEQKLKATQKEYNNLIKAMRQSEAKMTPVLASMNDQVLYLKHNLNANAIRSIESTVNQIDRDVEALILTMQKSITLADAFIKNIEG